MKKMIFVLGFLILGVGLFYNCDKGGNKTKIRFAIWGDVEELKILNSLKDKFEKKNPGVEIKFEHSSIDSYRDKLLTEVAGEVAPDVAFMATSRFAGLVEKKVFIPLDNFIKNDAEINKKMFYKKMITAFSRNNKLYILPRDIAPGSVIYYNKLLFDQAGIKYPDNNWTMKDFVNIAVKLTKYGSDGTPTQFGFNTWLWNNFVYMYGGREVDNPFKPRKFLLTSKKSLKGLKFYHDLMYKYKVMPTPVLANNIGMSFTMAFSMKKVAMILSGIWETPVFRKECKFKWDILPFPGYQNGVWGGGSGYGILRGTKHPDLAWKIVKFFAGAEGEKELALSGLAQPAIRELALSKYFMDASKPPANKIILDTTADYIVLEPMFNDWNEILQTVINPNLELYLYNKINIDEMKKNIDKEIKTKYKYLQIP